MKGLAPLFVSVALGVQGCAGGGGCSDVGGFDGVGVEIPRALFVASGSVAFAVCVADDCATATTRLGAVPQGPVSRGASVTFDELGRRFEPGSVTVTVEMSDANGKVIVATQRDVQLTRSYPNGPSCDGEGHVGGTLALTPDDRL